MGGYSPEPRAEVYCFRLNFNINTNLSAVQSFICTDFDSKLVAKKEQIKNIVDYLLQIS